MRQSLAVIGWLLLLTGGVSAQTLTGSVAVSSIAGYQTNPYLDPMLNEWKSSFPRNFVAVVPSAGLTWSAERSRFGVHIRGRRDEHPGETVSSTLVRGIGYGSYEFSPRWELGGQGGWRRYAHYENSASRWLLPYTRWKPSTDLQLDLQIGWTGRTVRDSVGSAATYNSGFGMLDGSFWATDRLQLQAGVSVSDSRASSGLMSFGGSGVNSGLTYWVTNELSVSLRTGFQYLQYEMHAGSTADTTGSKSDTAPVRWQDLLWKGSAELRWQVVPTVTAFARGRMMQANHSFSSDGQFDGHVSAGATMQLSWPLMQRSESSPRPSLWRETDDGMQFELTYAGDGQLFITGDFNSWASPGHPLRSVGEERYAVELSLQPGRYQYSIRVIENGKSRWLKLPDDLRTVDDGFGNKNGVLVVY